MRTLTIVQNSLASPVAGSCAIKDGDDSAELTAAASDYSGEDVGGSEPYAESKSCDGPDQHPLSPAAPRTHQGADAHDGE